MLYVLSGGDELAARRRLAELRAAADGGSGMLDANTTTLDAQEATADAILAAAMAVPFLASRRLVIVDGLLDRFAGIRGGRGTAQDQGSVPGPGGQGKGLEGLRILLDVLDRDELPPTTDLVFLGKAAGTRNALLDRLRRVPGASVEEFAPPQRDDLLRFIRDEGAARGIRWRQGPSRREFDAGDEWRRPAAADPVALLAERFQSDTLALINELDKLALFAMGRDVTVDEVDLICSGERETTVFHFMDALMDGDLRTAFRFLERFRLEGASSQGLLAMMTTSYRRLAIIADLLEQGTGPEDIGKAIGLPWPRLRDAAIARAKRHGSGGIRTAYREIVDADRRIKLGEIDEDLAVDGLALELATLAPVRRPAGRARPPAR